MIAVFVVAWQNMNWFGRMNSKVLDWILINGILKNGQLGHLTKKSRLTLMKLIIFMWKMEICIFERSEKHMTLIIMV